MMTTDLSLRAGETRTLVVGPITDDDTGGPVTGLATMELTFAVKDQIVADDADALLVVHNAGISVSTDPTNGDTLTIALSASSTRGLLPSGWPGIDLRYAVLTEDISGNVKILAGGVLKVTGVAWIGTELA